MILSTEIIGNTQTDPQRFDGLTPDYLELDWYDLDKGILRRTTVQGREIGIKNLKAIPLRTGDVLFHDADLCVSVRVLPCLCLFIHPRNSLEMAKICFDIGNRHLPIVIKSAREVRVAYEAPLHRLFERQGYEVKETEAVLEQTQTLKIHQWTRTTKFKVTLAKNIDESTVDPAAD